MANVVRVFTDRNNFTLSKARKLYKYIVERVHHYSDAENYAIFMNTPRRQPYITLEMDSESVGFFNDDDESLGEARTASIEVNGFDYTHIPSKNFGKFVDSVIGGAR